MCREKTYEENSNIDQNLEKSQSYPHTVLNVKSFKEIDDLIKDRQHDIIVIKFYSERCRFCKEYSTIFEKFNKNYGHDLIFTQADVEDDLMFGYKFGITELPTTMIIKNGNFYYKEIGILKYSDMASRLEGLKTLKKKK